MKVSFIFLAVVSVWLSTFSAVGQTEKQEAAVPSATDGNGPPGHIVELNVLVVDRDKHPVAGLDGKSLQILDDGTSRTIASVSGAEGPISLCLVVDDSGSTFPMRQPMIDSVVALEKALPTGSELELVHFADKAFLDIPFTPVALVDEAKLRMMESRGGTAMVDAVVASVNSVLANAHNKRRALVIISDGGDNKSTLNVEQAVRRMEVLGAPMLYALGFPNEKESHEGNYANERRLKLLTKYGGGGVTLIAKNAKEIAKMTEEISAMIGSQVAISFTSPDTENPGRFHKLEVRRSQGAKGEEVYAMPGFFAMKPAAVPGTK